LKALKSLGINHSKALQPLWFLLNFIVLAIQRKEAWDDTLATLRAQSWEIP